MKSAKDMNWEEKGRDVEKRPPEKQTFEWSYNINLCIQLFSMVRQ